MTKKLKFHKTDMWRLEKFNTTDLINEIQRTSKLYNFQTIQYSTHLFCFKYDRELLENL